MKDIIIFRQPETTASERLGRLETPGIVNLNIYKRNNLKSIRDQLNSIIQEDNSGK